MKENGERELVGIIRRSAPVRQSGKSITCVWRVQFFGRWELHRMFVRTAGNLSFFYPVRTAWGRQQFDFVPRAVEELVGRPSEPHYQDGNKNRSLYRGIPVWSKIANSLHKIHLVN